MPKTSKTTLDLKPGKLVKAKVRWVLDGDSIIVKKEEGEFRIRLYGIDCPEHDQAGGDKAKSALVRLIGGKEVYIECHGEELKRDKYNRVLATIHTMHELELVNVNERMVMLGHAWVMRVFYTELSDSRKHKLNLLEKWAKSNQMGLWKEEDPLAPWVWRNKH